MTMSSRLHFPGLLPWLCAPAILLIVGCGGKKKTPAPTFLSQPTSVTVNAGQDATFSVTAKDATTYQWQLNSSPIKDATSATLTLKAVTSSMHGNKYGVTITGPGGTAESEPVTLGVQYLSITTHPSDRTVLDGGSAEFSTAFVGQPTDAQIQWQRSDTQGTTWIPLAGQTASKLSLGAVTYGTDNGARFRAQLSHVSGTYFSNTASLTVGAIAPAFTAHPSAQVVQSGNPVTFNCAYSGTQGTVLWQARVAGGTWTAIPDAQGDTLKFTANDSMDGNEYRAVISNPIGSAESLAALLRVTPNPLAPIYTVQPMDQTITAGQDATFLVDTSGAGTPTYQWFSSRNGETWNAINGATSRTYTWSKASVSDSGSKLRVTASNAFGVTKSNVATLTVLPLPTVPAFSTQPSNQTVLGGQRATFKVVFTGSPEPTCIWQKKTSSSAWADIEGATTPTLSFIATNEDNYSQYKCIATNTMGSRHSSAATLLVTPVYLAPAFTKQPVNATQSVGGKAFFTVEVTGWPKPTLQWQVSTDKGLTWSDIPDATDYEVATSALALTDSGNRYRCVATNSEGETISASATVTVTK